MGSTWEEVRTLDVDGTAVRVATRRGEAGRVPLLVFNGIGANLELLEPFAAAMAGTPMVAFDVPGVGGSAMPSAPYRLGGLAALARGVVRASGHDGPVDVLGLSWGGAAAQEFARRHGPDCRRLVLAATSMGAFMWPGAPSVWGRLLSPRRYREPGYLASVAQALYGGRLRERPELLRRHLRHIAPPRGLGYAYQLLAVWGWSSVFWLHRLEQPTLVMAGLDDPIVPVVNARLMAWRLRRATLCLVDDGHLFLVTQPRPSARVVQRFLAAA